MIETKPYHIYYLYYMGVESDGIFYQRFVLQMAQTMA